ncbi:hypothetical protein ACFWN1_20615 [Streptomyces sp. NPDC058459]|uniref:hypothetical protein n=1 Tax=Streptomyces sp. NPDC058459 TaxID=3346508 RepID=UPI00364D412C
MSRVRSPLPEGLGVAESGGAAWVTFIPLLMADVRAPLVASPTSGRGPAPAIPDPTEHTTRRTVMSEWTPSQAEGEREPDPETDGSPGRTIHPDVPRTTPSQAEGERLPEDDE